MRCAALALTCHLVRSLALPAKTQSAAPESYVPSTTSCPAGPLIRPADALGANEERYVHHRSRKASQALSTWLDRVLGGSACGGKVPRLALALSGGGTKAALTTAGAVYGLDGREGSNSSVAGLLQSMTYVSALSGGSLTLSGLMANNFATVSTLRRELWDASHRNVLAAGLSNAPTILADVGNKSAAGYPATLVDIYGRVISFNYIQGPPAGGNNILWSGITQQPAFQDHDAPYPVITFTQANVAAGHCQPTNTSAIWEVGPYEFGSWDSSVAAFYPTRFIGTATNHAPGRCVAGFDNAGFISGISSNILAGDTCSPGNSSASDLTPLAGLINTALNSPPVVRANGYGIIPNPFHQSRAAGPIRDQAQLYTLDGGNSGQAVPLVPWLQPARAIDVVVLVDALSDPPDNVTDGHDVHNTYLHAQAHGLSRMPAVPAPGPPHHRPSRPRFYGCHHPDRATLVHLPNPALNALDSSRFAYTPAQRDALLAGGLAMVAHPADPQWPACLACAIVHKTAAAPLPGVCAPCLRRYCWPAGAGQGAG